MRAKVGGFDPFYRGWEAYEKGGLSAVEQIEAPFIMLAFDQTDPDLADRLAERYSSQGLEPADLRFGMWPDASPQPVRNEDEPIGVHLNTFGGRQIRYGNATQPERAALDALTMEAEELVREALKPEHGVAVSRFGRVPTMHHHIVARERYEDGLDWLGERPLVDLAARRAMRDRLSDAVTSDRLVAIAAHVGEVLTLYAA